MEVIQISLQNINKPFLINRLKSIIKNKGLIVYPTDTLYGIGADPFSQKCIEKINQLKGRGEKQNISIAVHDTSEVKKICKLNETVEKACEKLLPGPITLVALAGSAAPKPVISPEGTVGIRVPDAPLTQELLKHSGPLTSTSANLHGGPDPIDIQIARKQLGDHIGLYLDGGPCMLKKSSTILDLAGKNPKILREGYISRRFIEDKLGCKVI